MNGSLYWAKSSAAGTLALLRMVVTDATSPPPLAGSRLPFQGGALPCAYAKRWPSVPSGTTDGQKKAVDPIIYYNNRMDWRRAEGRALRLSRRTQAWLPPQDDLTRPERRPRRLTRSLHPGKKRGVRQAHPRRL